jgi:hypothetical protein
VQKHNNEELGQPAMSDSTQDLPSSSRHRSYFLWIVIAISVALYGVDWQLVVAMELPDASAALKQHGQIIRSILENFIAGAIAAILLAFLYRTIVNLIDPADRVIEIERGGITARLIRNATRTRSYTFIGNTASFVSTVILPTLVDSARSSGQARKITLFLLDPTRQEAVLGYANYKDGARRAHSKVADQSLGRWVSPGITKGVESEEVVIAKVLAAIYYAAYAALPAGMEVTVYLRASFTPFRADISDSEAVLTQESASESAVAFSSSGHFYSWYEKEADAQRGQSTPLDLTKRQAELRALLLAAPSESVGQITVSLTQLLGVFPPLHPLIPRKDVLARAAKLIAHPSPPYQ